MFFVPSFHDSIGESRALDFPVKPENDTVGTDFFHFAAESVGSSLGI